jgi:hypothetical protein
MDKSWVHFLREGVCFIMAYHDDWLSTLSGSGYDSALLTLYYLVLQSIFYILPNPEAPLGYYLRIGFHPPENLGIIWAFWVMAFVGVFLFKSFTHVTHDAFGTR